MSRETVLDGMSSDRVRGRVGRLNWGIEFGKTAGCPHHNHGNPAEFNAPALHKTPCSHAAS